MTAPKVSQCNNETTPFAYRSAPFTKKHPSVSLPFNDYHIHLLLEPICWLNLTSQRTLAPCLSRWRLTRKLSKYLYWWDRNVRKISYLWSPWCAHRCILRKRQPKIIKLREKKGRRRRKWHFGRFFLFWRRWRRFGRPLKHRFKHKLTKKPTKITLFRVPHRIGHPCLTLRRRQSAFHKKILRKPIRRRVDASLGQNNRSASLRLPRIRHKLSQIITQKRELR